MKDSAIKRNSNLKIAMKAYFIISGLALALIVTILIELNK